MLFSAWDETEYQMKTTKTGQTVHKYNHLDMQSYHIHITIYVNY